MLKKPHYIILVVVVLVVLVLLKLPGETMGKVKLAISGLFLPLFGLAGSTHELAGEAREEMTPKRELVRQIEQLRSENQQQKIQLEQDASLWTENARLRAAAGWQRQTRWRVKLARVIARDPANWWRSLQIDLGAQDGIRTNLPVLTADGLVGRIQSVSEHRSQVVLLGDPEFRVAAVVETTNETGIITAGSSAPQEQGMIDLDLLSGASLVRPGQSVTTWGAGGVFPGGIPIGKIVDTRSKEFGLSMEARVKLAANLGSLEEVWVMVP
jgi:rod shape-determining protein MreC